MGKLHRRPSGNPPFVPEPWWSALRIQAAPIEEGRATATLSTPFRVLPRPIQTPGAAPGGTEVRLEQPAANQKLSITGLSQRIAFISLSIAPLPPALAAAGESGSSFRAPPRRPLSLAPTYRLHRRPQRPTRHRRVPPHHPLRLPPTRRHDDRRREALVQGHRRAVPEVMEVVVLAGTSLRGPPARRKAPCRSAPRLVRPAC